jgi:hypothetical protein
MAVRDKKKQTETGFITAGDRYLFGEGTHYEIYNKLGAHPKTFNGKTGYYFAVWAPHAASVSVVGDFNNWDPDACPMQVLETSGIYERFIPDIKPGELYKFAITTQTGKVIFKADPFAQYAEYRKEFGKSFESKKDNLTRDLSQKAMNAGRTPYVISKDGIQLTPEWTRYFIENNPIITECTYFKLTQFLQQKNPSVPAISEKLIQPTSRNSLDFSRAKDYWRSAIERDGDVYDIYTLRHFTKDALESLGPMSVDHFVPWKFVLHDQIWNLVPTFRSPNSSKNDNLPDTAYLDDFCSVQFIGLTANRETQHFRKVIESYRDVIPNAEQFVATLENKEAFSEKLKNAILPLLLQAKNQGFTDWTNTYRGV